jgi:Ca2+-binding RTX toxin-like protein
MARNKQRPLAAAVTAGAVIAALALPAAAGADTVNYPAGGSTFSGSAEGWTGAGGACGPAAGLDVTCTTSAQYSGTQGNPPGSIESTITVLANAGGLLTGTTTWTSPDFTLTAPVKAAAFAMDRQLDPQGLPALDPQSSYTVSLIDHSAGDRATPLQTDNLAAGDTTFTRRGNEVPAGALVQGHSYAISIKTTSTTRTARVGVAGSLATRYDNIDLTTDDTAPGSRLTPIGDGAQGSPGVKVTGPPLSDGALARLLTTFNPFADVGKGPGGSVVPLAKCTITGTPRSDVIKGTKGNDVICGLGGNDRIAGNGGSDVVDTGDGNDLASGNTGSDTLIGVRGKDRLNGNSGNDRVGGGASADRLTGAAGGDRMDGGSGNDRVLGSAGNDRLAGGKGGDRIAGDAGKDRISARDRTRDRIDGGSGRDTATVDRRRRGARASRKASRRVDSLRRVERVR